jgi:maltooligosyltrehalose trehalohydrolase
MDPVLLPMPGAILERPGGKTRFRVWAPRPAAVHLKLCGPVERTVPMHRDERGYYEVTLDGIAPGQRYLFRLGDGPERPDPASRWQPDGVHVASAVADLSFQWHDEGWRGLPLRELVLYELHVGTFTPEGTFDSAIGELGRLRDLGVNAIELMPVAQFPGWRNWGYDGVFPFAVQHSYGGVAGLERLVNACHQQGIAVFLDVVFNHLGPEGNYLREFGPYFTDQYRTPWGEAVNFDGPGSDDVRAFFLANARMWQEEFHLDGLRLDATHAIKDFSAHPFLAELAQACAARAAALGRPFHLIAENDQNDARLLRPVEQHGLGMSAQWSDDFHHAVHTLLTGERGGYYADFGELEYLERACRDGWVYSGEVSAFRQRRHGTDPTAFPAEQFVVCVQNHDQVGNRARGERLSALVDFEGLKLAAGLVLLSPYVPLLFMGEEYGEAVPFLYFTSHGDPGLVESVRRGRREEFAGFAWQGEVPDPQDEATFLASKLRTTGAAQGHGRVLHDLYRNLIGLRRTVPALAPGGLTRPVVHRWPDRRVLMVQRTTGGDTVIALFHLGERESRAAWPWPAGEWELLLDSAAPAWQGPGDAPRTLSGGEVQLRLWPRSFVLYRRKRG